MSKTHGVLASATAAMVILVLGLSGCSAPSEAPAAGSSQESTGGDDAQQAALEKYMDAERAQLPTVMDSTEGVFSDITVDSFAPDAVTFTYTYAAQVDPVSASEYFDSSVSTIQDLCDTSVFPAMKSAGVEGAVDVIYVYINADGSEIWQKTFSPS